MIIEGDEGPLMCQAVDCERHAGISADPPGTSSRCTCRAWTNVLPDTFTSVNTFRVVFREYFGADLEPLPDRSFTWPDNDHIYDFRDVTDQILASSE